MPVSIDSNLTINEPAFQSEDFIHSTQPVNNANQSEQTFQRELCLGNMTDWCRGAC